MSGRARAGVSHSVSGYKSCPASGVGKRGRQIPRPSNVDSPEYKVVSKSKYFIYDLISKANDLDCYGIVTDATGNST